jgi:hypothetical protein
MVCDQPVSLIDIYPTFNELLGLNTHPNAGGNGYELEGHSIMPFIKNPVNGTWNGPDVAITALPGKDHMLHTVYEGSLYPHFSVRGKRWRYSLASDGGEELYDHESDPLEWNNLASDPEYAVIKASLKDQLIELRDGDQWESLEELDAWTMPSGLGEYSQRHGEIRLSGASAFDLATVDKHDHFEFEADMRTGDDNTFRIAYRGFSGDGVSTPAAGSDAARYGHFQNGEWNRYRIRVHNDRHQLWINNKMVTDEMNEGKWGSGVIRILYPGGEEAVQLRNVRIRKL